MKSTERIYLDNAATSWPKPEAVYAAVDQYQRNCGAPAGRSAYAEAIQVERAVEDARVAVARLIGLAEPSRVVFTSNGTDALNLAIHGLLKSGDHVVTTVAEHNSVLRPLRFLEEHAGVSVTRLACDGQGLIDPEDIRSALRDDTRLVALIHASNVTGAIQPVEQVAELVRPTDALLLVDAAQSLGHIPIAFDKLGCDLLAAPGHKGLLGPLGTGILAIGEGVETALRSIRQGGTGTSSEDDHQPDSLPDKYESGNHNVPGILGLAAGLECLAERGVEDVRRHSRAIVERLIAGLSEIEGVTIYGPTDPDRRVGVVSVYLQGYDPQEVAATLDAAFRIQVRSGIHCAPLMHQALGTLDLGGTIRFSCGPFTTESDIEAAISAMHEIASASPVG